MAKRLTVGLLLSAVERVHVPRRRQVAPAEDADKVVLSHDVALPTGEAAPENHLGREAGRTPQAGVPVHVVAARLGHADPAITLRVYAHVIHEQAASAADVFAKAVNG